MTELSRTAIFGEDGWWVRHLPWAWQACAAPALADPPPAAWAGDDDNQLSLRAARWSALAHILTFGLGWSRLDAGLANWTALGRPTTDPILAVTEQWWGTEIDGLLAFLTTSPNIIEALRSQVAPQAHVRLGPTTDPIDFTRIKASPDWRAQWEGGWDPLHLSGHIAQPLQAPLAESLLTPLQIHEGLPRRVLKVQGYTGWMRQLSEVRPSVAHGRSVRVEVVSEALGWLGEYRKSDVTHLWFRGRHATHMLGN